MRYANYLRWPLPISVVLVGTMFTFACDSPPHRTTRSSCIYTSFSASLLFSLAAACFHFRALTSAESLAYLCCAQLTQNSRKPDENKIKNTTTAIRHESVRNLSFIHGGVCVCARPQNICLCNVCVLVLTHNLTQRSPGTIASAIMYLRLKHFSANLFTLSLIHLLYKQSQLIYYSRLY